MSESAFDEAPSRDTLVSLVPELFFDLISRIPAGVIFLAFLATDPRLMARPMALTDINFATIVGFAFVGYAAGLVLNGLGGMVALVARRAAWVWVLSREPRLCEDMVWFADSQGLGPSCLRHDRVRRHREVDVIARHVHDYLRVCHRDFRALLPKLVAETALCANLLVAFLAIASFSHDVRREFALWAALLYAIALLFREWATTQRHCSFLALVRSRQIIPRTAGESTPDTATAALHAR